MPGIAASPIKWTFGFCEPCQKYLYETRKNAKKSVRLHRNRHMNVYSCPVEPTMFHVGGLAEPVIQGLVSREQLYNDGYRKEAG